MKYLALLIFMSIGCSKQDSPITLTLGRTPVVEFSVLPEESDFLSNFILLDHLVETLFKNSQSGTPEPSAVKDWSSSSDQKEWKFTLKRGLVDEKGKELSPSYWCEGIQKVLKRLPRQENMILLSRLEGWGKFLKGERDFPVNCNDQEFTISFKFTEKPEGILDYLSMPVLGFWSGVDRDSFVASGAFRITKYSASEFQLARNGNTKENMFSRAVIRSVSAEDIQKNGIAKNEIIMPVEPVDELKQDSTLVKAYPTQLVFAEFNDSKSSILASDKTRRELYAAVARFKNEDLKFSDDAVRSDAVFFDVQPPIKFDATSQVSAKVPKLKVLVSKGGGIGTTRAVVDGILKQVLPKFTDQLEVVELDTSDKMWQIVINRDYDIRIGAVEAGTHPNKWVAEMMFCSHQGITFIDPQNKICQGLKGLKDTEGDKVGALLNRVTAESYVLLPLFNKSALLYVGKGIDDSGVYAGSPMPRLDRLKVAE